MSQSAPTPITTFGTARPGDLAGMTGLEQLNAMIEGRLPAPTMARTLGFTIVSVAEGRGEFAGTPGPEVLNPMGIVHGGWIMTLLDSALGCAVHTTLAPGEGYVSLDTQVKFVKAITPGSGRITVIGQVQTRGRQIATATGEARDAQGRILATGTSSCLIRQMPGA